ncbi:MAG TPA: glutathione binding-like protein [Geminicoccus sp.]|jgi:glutathione S-transferase|uniref:glutathione S-transferase family protein n=1 Tax=Geminicoccus sp. TaxID=2024832 RepID=UPI002E355B51|nr:glutathione binding-like protein [Geminicoccus sp.]HEX2525982.1 glutathione binding-like protein [Geminicoccus sp.]
MIRVWGRVNSLNVQKVMWTIAELGLAHERQDVGGPFGGLDTAEYAARNPNRLIPVIDDHGTVVWESNAIVRYLAARWGRGTLWNEEPAMRAQADQWMDWQQTTVQPVLGPLFIGFVRTPLAQRDEEALAGAARRLGDIFSVLDKWLADHPFVAGDSLTMGDIPAAAATNRYMQLPVDRPVLGNLQRWYQGMATTATFRKHVMIPLS